MANAQKRLESILVAERLNTRTKKNAVLRASLKPSNTFLHFILVGVGV